MAKRGRKSAAELLTPPPIRDDGRPSAPADMTAEQIAVWDRIVASEPADWFASGARQDLLRLYCEHHAFRAELQALIQDCKIGVIADEHCGRDFDLMLRVRDRETKTLTALARQMRLTHQSRYTPQAAGTAGRNNPTGSRPWAGNAALNWK